MHARNDVISPGLPSGPPFSASYVCPSSPTAPRGLTDFSRGLLREDTLLTSLRHTIPPFITALYEDSLLDAIHCVIIERLFVVVCEVVVLIKRICIDLIR